MKLGLNALNKDAKSMHEILYDKETDRRHDCKIKLMFISQGIWTSRHMGSTRYIVTLLTMNTYNAKTIISFTYFMGTT